MEQLGGRLSSTDDRHLPAILGPRLINVRLTVRATRDALRQDLSIPNLFGIERLDRAGIEG